MNKTQDHYNQQLAAVYSWMSGNPETAIARNHDLFCQLAIDSVPRGLGRVFKLCTNPEIPLNPP